MKLLKFLFRANLVSPPFLFARQWQTKKETLLSKVSKDVKANNGLPKYNRPQMTLQKWNNRNGLWQLQQSANKTEAFSTGQVITHKCRGIYGRIGILVKTEYYLARKNFKYQHWFFIASSLCHNPFIGIPMGSFYRHDHKKQII